jgi:hypothetical protein
MQNGWNIHRRNGHTGLVSFPQFGRSAATCWRTQLARGGVPFYKTAMPYPNVTAVDTCFVLEKKDKLIVSARIGWY